MSTSKKSLEEKNVGNGVAISKILENISTNKISAKNEIKKIREQVKKLN